MMQAQTGNSETLELSLTPRNGLVLGLAAKAAGCPIDEFVLQSALSHARETLPDRRHFGLDAEQWAAFMAALDAPPREFPGLRRLFEERTVFDQLRSE
jgi:uncharacterized protein (DUF1778 family)